LRLPRFGISRLFWNCHPGNHLRVANCSLKSPKGRTCVT
jgi:hypothetical protein